MAAAGNDSPVPCLRVTQLDADDLDNYLVDLLMKNQLDKALRLLPKYVSWVRPELQTAMYAALLHYTTGKRQQTVGQRLFGVMLAESPNLIVPSKKKIWTLMGLEILLHWWMSRYSHVHPGFVSSRPKIAKCLDVVMSAEKLFEVINFAVFLRTGEFNKLLYRILGLRIIFDDPNPEPGSISYAILSREILWKGFAEASMYFLSMFDIRRWKKQVARYLHASQGESQRSGLKTCAICGEWLTQPHEADCGHVLCYYCGSVEIAIQASCPCCNSAVSNRLLPLKVQYQSIASQ